MALLLSGPIPAVHAEEAVEVSVAPVGVEPPVYHGLCAPEVRFVLTAAITAKGPGTVSYLWSPGSGERGQLTFTEAGTKTVQTTAYQYVGSFPGPHTAVLSVRGANAAHATFTYSHSCTDAVPQTTQIQPVEYVGRCGSDVTHTISAQIDSPVARTVRYRWTDGNGQPLPGLEAEREVVFTEPGSKTVSAPFQRLALNNPYGYGVAEVNIVSPSPVRRAVTYRTTCVTPEFTALTRVSGSCTTGTPFKFSLTGYVESDAIAEISYAWSRKSDLDGDWVREPWKTLSFTADGVPGRKTVTTTGYAGGESTEWRLEVLGTDGVTVSRSRGFRIPCAG
ncbi:hypothetical protein [Planobispora takensis]|uniref:hypothetical protein n=1 Tax=Planobispora takensis TaxID=1367882 RepID=UPI0019407EB6|nr:hypothetical protein [Planobispora takensis]